jgi:hypothetical protein
VSFLFIIFLCHRHQCTQTRQTLSRSTSNCAFSLKLRPSSSCTSSLSLSSSLLTPPMQCPGKASSRPFLRLPGHPLRLQTHQNQTNLPLPPPLRQGEIQGTLVGTRTLGTLVKLHVRILKAHLPAEYGTTRSLFLINVHFYGICIFQNLV